ncbi:Cytochrome P450 72A15 [Linum perenne]
MDRTGQVVDTCRQQQQQQAACNCYSFLMMMMMMMMFSNYKWQVLLSSVVLALVIVGITSWVWKVMNWVWLKPKKLERQLRNQGFHGRSYRFLKGDLNENIELRKEAISMHLDFSQDPALRILPLSYHTVKTYGKNSFTWFGPIPRVHIMNPEDIKEVMTKTYEYTKSGRNPLVKMLASGLASYNGDKWAQHRRIINPAFHQEKLKLMVPVFYKSCKEIVDVWEQLVVSNGGSYELDVWPSLQSMTCDIISRTAFGSSYQEGKRIFDLLKEQSVLVMQIVQQVYIPGWRFVPTKRNTRMKHVSMEIRESLKGIITKREKAMKIGEVVNNTDLLGVMMEANRGTTNNVTMTLEELIEECKLFYFAGQETTSVLLVWTMILLSKYPNWQERARDEVLHALGDNDVPDYSDLGHLKITSMILHEVLRLYPPVVMLNRAVEKDMKLGNVVLPAGVQILLPAIMIHKDPQLWGNDAGQFNPDRFSEGVSQATKNQQQVAYFPFGWGPRICIGQNFALLEAKMALAIILKRFSFQLSPSYVHAPSTEAVTLQPQFGAPLILDRL